MADQRSFRTQLRMLRRAFEADDRQRVGWLLLRLQESDRSPAALLQEFADAIASGEYEEAEAVLELLRETYDERISREAARFERAVAVRSQSDISTEQQTRLDDHREQAIAVEFDRSAFLLEAASFLTDPENSDEESVLEASESLGQREQRFERVQEETQQDLTATTLPARIRILQVDAETLVVRDSSSLQVTVRNIGDEPATGVHVAVDGERAIQVDGTPATTDEIPAADTSSFTFDMSATEPGEYRLVVTVESDTAGSDTKVSSIDVQETTVATEESLETELPEWIIPLGGAGTLGATGYVALKYLSSRAE